MEKPHQSDSDHANCLVDIKQEIAILRAVQHPCIINTHAVYHFKTTTNIVMELASGGDLFDRICERGQFTEREDGIVMTQLLSAVAYLHERNIVHRDLKPENILLVSTGADWRIKVADFRLAKVLQPGELVKACSGTNQYLAPEVVVMRAGQANNTCWSGFPVDIWASGVIFFCCLSGEPPFSDQLALLNLFGQIKQGGLSFRSDKWEKVSASAIDLIKRMLIVNPNLRLTAEQACTDPFFSIYGVKTNFTDPRPQHVLDLLDFEKENEKLKALPMAEKQEKEAAVCEAEELRCQINTFEVDNTVLKGKQAE
ncbi:Checkpoint kinase 2 [Podochytrium sp. JEL0797]|nr:Checkpoint kinase 2 [Podochytrium sp. JEL0797]